jgi:hypothetical protein
MTPFRALVLALSLLAPLACSRQSDNDSLREGLAGLPEDTTPLVVPETTMQVPPAMDSEAALPDTAGLPSVPAPSLADDLAGEVPQETVPRGLRPEPRDTRPWIPTTPALPPAGWTTEPSMVRGGGMPSLLVAVRAARNDEFDRVVFQFEGAQLPGYDVQYLADPARQCGSGQRAPVAGRARLLVRLTPAQMHRDDGRGSLVPHSIRTELDAVTELRSTCDFEGQVAWVLGIDNLRPYRVISLHNPARLVVDVRR